MINRTKQLARKDELAVVDRAVDDVPGLWIERSVGMHADGEFVICDRSGDSASASRNVAWLYLRPLLLPRIIAPWFAEKTNSGMASIPPIWGSPQSEAPFADEANRVTPSSPTVT
jgi:hypothetical protein